MNRGRNIRRANETVNLCHGCSVGDNLICTTKAGTIRKDDGHKLVSQVCQTSPLTQFHFSINYCEILIEVSIKIKVKVKLSP
jgi:hypothetical protein